MRKKSRRLIPPGLQSWPLQLIEHLTNTTSVVPPPAGPAGFRGGGGGGCRPLYFLRLLNLSFTIYMYASNRCCILQFRATKVLYATSFVLIGAKAKFLRRKPRVLVALDEISDYVDPNPCSL